MADLRRDDFPNHYVGDLVQTERGWVVVPPTCCPDGHRYGETGWSVSAVWCSCNDRHMAWRCHCGAALYAPQPGPHCRRLSVYDNAVQIGQRDKLGQTKSRTERSVPVPQFVLNQLAVQCEGRGLGDLLFGDDGATYLPRPKSSNGWFRRAVKTAGIQAVRTTCVTTAPAWRSVPGSTCWHWRGCSGTKTPA